MQIGLLILEVNLPACGSLKEKRGRLKPLINRLQKDYKLSVAEVDLHEVWQSSIIACVMVSNDNKHTQSVLQKVSNWVEREWRDLELVDHRIEMV
ncbi:MAG: DUF503 domain-containing protein [Chloroflexi bacterium]|nr:MAG: DUF503 domain-containing protein [Chloroflexota bacterium]MBL1195985.1 DUF503 domain-containing protein [Chloroflexota bacterium]NOH13279.1 DUF503 domain-containing protein [Chloroflexota bacterium]